MKNIHLTNTNSLRERSMTNHLINNRRFFHFITKAVCILLLAGAFTMANGQCDLKLTEKVVKQLKDDNLEFLKDIAVVFEEVNDTKTYSFLLRNDSRFFLYFGVSESSGSEIKFWITPDNTNKKQITLTSGKISRIELTPTETGIFNISAQLIKGEKSCGVIALC